MNEENNTTRTFQQEEKLIIAIIVVVHSAELNLVAKYFILKMLKITNSKVHVIHQ